MIHKGYTYDAALLLRDAGAVTASRPSQVAGAAKVLDLGANARMDGRIVVNVTAMAVSVADQKYSIIVQFSSSPTFASDIVNGASLLLGDATQTIESVDSALGEKEFGFTNEQGGTLRQYMRLYELIAGTTPSINFVAYAVK